ncbi:replication initiator [Microbispora bryophytorum]|uniref:replication initiator n=1 Tax=Microbispora bryophytorum TaxID=1460882 RepID=UPI00371B8ADB
MADRGRNRPDPSTRPDDPRPRPRPRLSNGPAQILPIREHARRLIAACMRLGNDPDLADPGSSHGPTCSASAGHFSTKSRRYSTTRGALRAAREEHMRTE